MKKKILAALVAVSAIAVAGCGSDDSAVSSSSSKGNGADRAFVADMVPHHQSAIEMAKIAQQRGQSDFVKQLADNIVRTQSAEITTLKKQDKELADAGVKKGDLGVAKHMMGMDMDAGMLKSASPFDKEFMTMMVTHHKGAITMAEAELDKGGDPELKQLAKDIISAQKKEVSEMEDRVGGGGSSMDGMDMG